jgi:hypothetical protein
LNHIIGKFARTPLPRQARAVAPDEESVTPRPIHREDKMEKIGIAQLVLALVAVSGFAASPPGLVSYQGVLRNAAGSPLTGSYDMVFTFYSASSGGDQILLDSHLAAGTGAVTVTNGLFRANLGGGALSDGTGAGTYTTLAAVLRDYGAVYVAVKVGAETLSPRVQVVSAAYSLNTDFLDGLGSADFATAGHNHTGTYVQKIGDSMTGTLSITPASGDGLTATVATGARFPIYASNSSNANQNWAFVSEATGPGTANVGAQGSASGASAINTGVNGFAGGNVGVKNAVSGLASGAGVNRGGEFQATDAAGTTNYGIWAQASGGGTNWAGWFAGNVNVAGNLTRNGNTVWDTGNDGAASGLDADTLDTRHASYFLDTSSTAQTKTAQLTLTAATGYGVSASGPTGGGTFSDSDGTSTATVASGANGIVGYGTYAGGMFENSAGTGYAHANLGRRVDLGSGVYEYYGIRSFGDTAGGYFKDNNSTGVAYVGVGDTGIDAKGSLEGGSFGDTDGSGTAHLAAGDGGIDASGNSFGGHFQDANNSGEAYAGYGDRGIDGYGDAAGGYFATTTAGGTASAWIGRYYNASEFWGLRSFGSTGGGYFGCSGQSGSAQVAIQDTGILVEGDDWAIYGQGPGTVAMFDNTAVSTWASIASNTSKIQGTGAMSFVQNHPSDPGKVIVYSAPEGDEVATYTRGTARLTNGTARVPLGATFRWVTNPDIGLTAHVTPREPCRGMYVETVGPTEMIVRELGGGTSSALFDYLVHGLRIGFEEVSIVQGKPRPATIPKMKHHEEQYLRFPELRTFDSLERFKAMEGAAGLRKEFDLGATEALKTSINRRTEIDVELEKALPPSPSRPDAVGFAPPPRRAEALPLATELPKRRESNPAPAGGPPLQPTTDPEGNVYGKSFRPSSPDFAATLPVADPVVVGDLVATDPDRPGLFRLSRSAEDPGIVGVVSGEPGVLLGSSGKGGASGDALTASVATSGIVRCRVDASFGAIGVNDLLVASPTPGHAMRTGNPKLGTIVGKALEPLESGTGIVRILVMLR